MPELSWTANTEPDLSHYNIYQDGVYLTQVPAGVTSYPISDASAAYHVTAVDTSKNESPASLTVNAVPPAPLHKFTIKELADSIVVSWNPADYPKVLAPRKTTKNLVTITIAKGY